MTNSKPIAFIEQAVISDWYGTPIQVLEGFCISHEARPDLVHRYIHTSEIVRKVEQDTYETKNSIYKVKSWKSND